MVGRRFLLAPLVLSLAIAGLSACARATASPGSPGTASQRGQDLQQQAAAEATAIIQRAEATALVLRAQAQATALLQGAETPEPTPVPQATSTAPSPTSTPAAPAGDAPGSPVSTAIAVAPKAQDGAPAVELMGVTFGVDGALIVVNFRASPEAAQKFWPGVLSVMDEATGTLFNEVPVMPVIGPLIARPREEGQLGYVMFVHEPAVLRSGSLVTVVLDTFKQEHVPVQ